MCFGMLHFSLNSCSVQNRVNRKTVQQSYSIGMFGFVRLLVTEWIYLNVLLSIFSILATLFVSAKIQI